MNFKDAAPILKARWDIDTTKLGCVMLDVEQVPVENWLPKQWAYHAKNTSRYWIKGFDVTSHVTLLYGLLDNANAIRHEIAYVLDRWEAPKTVEVSEVSFFPTSFPGEEEYACIIGKVVLSEELKEAHRRLQLLPHIDTFPYEAHLTFGYVHEHRRDDAVQTVMARLNKLSVPVTGINYGRE